MSSGGSSRVSIPSSVKKTIQDIKEIAGNHADDEIYEMLQECSMDPNETAQKLLFQDTFHEVKRKRDKRKENLNNKEQMDSRWKPGMQGRGIRGGRGSYHSRYLSHDAGGINAGKEDGVIQATEKGVTSPSSIGTQEIENKSGVLASGYVSGIANASANVGHVSSSQGPGSQMSCGGGFFLGEDNSNSETMKSGCAVPTPIGTDSKNGPTSIGVLAHRKSIPSSDQFSSTIAVSDSGSYAPDTDVVPVSLAHTDVSGLVRTIKCEVGSQRPIVEPTISKLVSQASSGSEISSEKASSEIVSSSKPVKLATKSLGLEVSHLSDVSQPLPSKFQSPSNVSSRLQQVIGPQKVGPSKEWKPKSMNQVLAQASGTIGTSDTLNVRVEMDIQSVSVQNSEVPEEAASKLQKKLEELNFLDNRHVIIPNHLQVPEAERSGLSFGSFDANFGIGTRSTSLNDADSEKSSTPLTESSEGPEEHIEEHTLSSQNVSSTSQEEQYPEHRHSPSQMPENLSTRGADISLNVPAVPEHEQSKQASAVAQGGPQFSVVHTTPAYSAFGLIPPMLGSQLAPLETSEPQVREASRVTSLVVQQPFDPSTSHYTYRPGVDVDGRASPSLAHGGTTKYNGSTAVLSPQAGQSTQETVNSLVLPTTGVGTQGTGVVQTSVAVTQQPVPFFRHPAGVHISHYPPNYMPYGHYFSPFYVPTPAIHHFFSNTAFPQQPLAGSMYPPPAASATTPKYPFSQYKSGSTSGNSTHTVMPAGHGPYNSNPTGYSPNPVVTSGSSTGNEDHTVSQYKENNAYITGQQNEGSAVWIPAPGRDIPSVQAGSFYNLPQGQHMPFATPQAANGAFAGIYHPAQSVGAATVHHMLQPSQTMAGAVEMVGPPAGLYQQPQRSQINWASNY